MSANYVLVRGAEVLAEGTREEVAELAKNMVKSGSYSSAIRICNRVDFNNDVKMIEMGRSLRKEIEEFISSNPNAVIVYGGGIHPGAFPVEVRLEEVSDHRLGRCGAQCVVRGEDNVTYLKMPTGSKCTYGPIVHIGYPR